MKTNKPKVKEITKVKKSNRRQKTAKERYLKKMQKDQLSRMLIPLKLRDDSYDLQTFLFPIGKVPVNSPSKCGISSFSCSLHSSLYKIDTWVYFSQISIPYIHRASLIAYYCCPPSIKFLHEILSFFAFLSNLEMVAFLFHFQCLTNPLTWFQKFFIIAITKHLCTYLYLFCYLFTLQNIY